MLLRIPNTSLLIVDSGEENKFWIYKDSDLTLLKIIEHKFKILFCGWYSELNKMMYLGMGSIEEDDDYHEGWLIEFDPQT